MIWSEFAGVFRAALVLGLFEAPGTCVGDARVQSEGQLMPTEFKYRGDFVTDCTVPGEGKASGYLPAQPLSGAVRASANHWLFTYATLETSGWDLPRAIIVQIRRDRPDGPVVREVILADRDEAVDPLARGEKLLKAVGSAKVFGVPSGAKIAGRVPRHAGLFVARWYRKVFYPAEDGPINPATGRDRWPEGQVIANTIPPSEWVHFRFDPQRETIDMLGSVSPFVPTAYEADPLHPEATGLLGGMLTALPTDEAATQWHDIGTIRRKQRGSADATLHLIAQRFTYDAERDRYRFETVGEPFGPIERHLSEASLARAADRWIVAARSNRIDGSTLWFVSDDPNRWPSEPAAVTPVSWGPRTLWRCGDGRLRLFAGDRDRSPYGEKRNPLYAWEVDLVGGLPRVGEPTVVFDAAAHDIPFDRPFADFAQVLEPMGRIQPVVFRLIDSKMTTGGGIASRAALAAAGIHRVDLVYEAPAEPEWVF